VPLARRRKLVDVSRDQVVRDNVFYDLEPVYRHRRKNLAFVRNQRRQNDVERRNAIACDQQQAVAQIVNVTNLAAVEQL
jgi:hypothetical protein